MKKPFNLRLPVLGACAMLGGIAYAVLLCRCGADGIFILIPPIILFAACVPVAVITKSASKPLILIFFSVIFLFAAIYAAVNCVSYMHSDVPTGVISEITGRVEEVNITASGRRYIVLRNVYVEGVRLNGKLIAWLGEDAGDYCRQGYTVSMRTALQKFAFIEDGGINYRAAQGIKYYATVNEGLTAKYGFSLFGEMNASLQSALHANMSSETAAVCYAMLTGNTGAISEGTLASFRYGGIAHVFAVSGLHIGVIYGILSFTFKKLRFNEVVSTILKIAVIALYCGVCGFSPSSVRAVVTCSLSAIATCMHRKYDGLNALAIAALIILIINPLSLFSVSFVLSFSAMLAIMVLSRNLRTLFSFLPKKLGGAVSVGLSAQLGTMPAMLWCFGYVSWTGLFLNLIFIPIISVLYILLFVCALLSTVIAPAAPFLLTVAGTPIELVINIAVACGFENAIFTADASALIFLPFAVVILGLSDKIRLRSFLRCAAVSVSVLAVVLSAVRLIPHDDAIVTFEGGYGGGSVLIRTGEGAVLVATEGCIKNGNLRGGVEALVLLDDDLTAVTRSGLEFSRVYVKGGTIGVPVPGAEVICSDSFTACGVEITYSGDICIISVEGVTVTVADGKACENYTDPTESGRLNMCMFDWTGSVLFTKDGSLGLETCGKVRYKFDGGEYYLLSKTYGG